MPFDFEKLRIPEVVLVKPKVFHDDRGFFLETYEKNSFEKAGIKTEFVQDNHSKSQKNVLRGMHFQKNPYAQAKLVRCIKGEILDVAVDLRVNSETFGKYVAVKLTEENKHELYIPRGFAHGFLVLSEEAEIVYKVDNFYHPESEESLKWNDEQVAINWGLSEEPILSNKDKEAKGLKELKDEGSLF